MDINPTQEGLYNVRAAIPDHLDVFTRWRKWSDEYKAEHPAVQIDLPYGEGPDETLDYFPALPTNAQGGPLLLLIHGGYWQAMDKADTSFAARELNTAGINVAVVNHTLCPHTTLEEIDSQIGRAIIWLWCTAQELGADPEQLFIAGHSAGGHLAALSMTHDWSRQTVQIPHGIIKGGIAISGLFDLTALMNTSINIKVGLNDQAAKTLSPINHRPVSDAPLILAVGSEESIGFHGQMETFARAWGSVGSKIETMVLPGCHHFGAFEALALKDSPLLAATLALMAQNRTSFSVR